MQVTEEMARAAWQRWLEIEDEGSMDRDAAMRHAVQAALDVMPKATGGFVPGGATADHFAPRPADVTPPQKVRDAADAVPGITFNLDQQYGGIDEAAAQKLRLNIRGDNDHAAGEQ